ncbi:hypothetical protein CRN42_08330 [Vibrio vulnificus]|nr:hypothetical protein CRN42_08330 [Vibrio vulnificus]
MYLSVTLQLRQEKTAKLKVSLIQQRPAEKQKINPRIVLMNFNNASMLDKVYNALLRGEQRNTEVAAYHLKH